MVVGIWPLHDSHHFVEEHNVLLLYFGFFFLLLEYCLFVGEGVTVVVGHGSVTDSILHEGRGTLMFLSR